MSEPAPPTPIHGRSWGTDGGEYSPSKFYVTSSDAANERSTQLRVWVPLSFTSEMAEIIQGGKIGDYRKVQDMVRDALYHRLHYLRDHIDSPALERTLGIYKMQAQMDAQMRRAEAEDLYVDSARANLAQASRNPVEQRALVEMLRAHVTSMDLSVVGRRTLEAELANYARDME